MLAPDPALAALPHAVRTASHLAARATGDLLAGNGVSSSDTGVTSPVFDLLADPAAALTADSDGKAAKATAPRGRIAQIAREPAPVEAAVDAALDAVLVAVPPAALPPPTAPDPAPRPEFALAEAPAEVATSAESAAAPAATRPAAGAPAFPPAAATPEAPGPLAVEGTAPPSSAPDARPTAAARAAEPRAAMPALPGEAPPAPAKAEAAAAAAPGTVPALIVAVGWQLVPPPAAVAVAGRASAPTASQAVVDQVTVAVARSGGGARKVELRLDPPELGRVEIHLAPTERGALHATVVAERAETYELLRRHGEVLARELGAAGYSDVTLSFSSSSGDPAGRGGLVRPPEPQHAAFLTAPDERAPSPAAPRPAPRADGGLDIRL